jgi:hypothetical protein
MSLLALISLVLGVLLRFAREVDWLSLQHFHGADVGLLLHPALLQMLSDFRNVFNFSATDRSPLHSLGGGGFMPVPLFE